MTNVNACTGAPRATLAAAALIGALALGGCNGGGVTLPADSGASSSSGSSSGSSSSSSGSGSTSSSSSSGGGTVTPTAYTLFSSNYSAYSAQTNGAYVYSVQGGNVYAGTGGNFGYGQYSSPQADMDRTQLYIYQAQAGATPPATAGDYFYVAIKPPGSAATSTFAPLDISQSTTMLIQMGNTYTSSNNNNLPGGNVKVFTVDINNDTSAAGDGSQETADCSYDQTLAAIGIGANSALGVLNYKIPLSSFTTCAKGDIATLQASGVINVAIKVTGDKNPGIVANEFDTIAIGYIGFTK